jgi:inosose dehydratase
MPSRRHFLGSLAATAALPALAAEGAKLHLATNVYPWLTFYGREKRDWNKDKDASLGEVARAGLDGFEPIANAPADIRDLAPRLKKAKLEMRSLYMNALLHEKAKAGETIKNALAVADEGRKVGLKVMVVNPTPIRWGGGEDKSDEQLKVQAAELDRLGAALRKRDVTLAYHNHDAEMRRSAREFHHMMLGTDADNVKLCLDSHWVYRGSGDSQVALFDVVKLYVGRIVELHLRQSKKGVWTETFGEGDIDYGRLVKALVAKKLRPLCVLEQAVEAKSPNTLKAGEAHARGAKYGRRLLAPLAG